METQMKKTYTFDAQLVEVLTRLKYRLDLDTEGDVLLRAVALLNIIEQEKDSNGYIRFLDKHETINRINIVG
jgi:hypothetical protein